MVEQKQPDIPLTEKDKKKEVVIQGVIAGKITQKTAATMLELSTRQIRRLEERYEAGGAAALVHQGRGKLSNHQGSVEDVGRVLELLHGKYKDMGPILAAEQLEERDGIKISRETIRRLLIKEGLWEASSQLNEKHRRWRQRSPCFGSLVQMDTSFHNWFGNDHPKSYLIAMIDDATSKLYARFYEAENTVNNMDLIKRYIELNGVPEAIYVDRASHFKVNKNEPKNQENESDTPARDGERQTQIQRAVTECGSKLIFARSPQAKGRVERVFGTLQDRLIKLMKLDMITSIESANDYLDKYFLPKWDKRFTHEPSSQFNAHRDKRDYNLNAIFCPHAERVVQNDFTIRLFGKHFQIEAGNYGGSIRRKKVIIEQRMDGTFKARYNNTYLHMHRIS